MQWEAELFDLRCSALLGQTIKGLGLLGSLSTLQEVFLIELLTTSQRFSVGQFRNTTGLHSIYPAIRPLYTRASSALSALALARIDP